MEIRDWDSNHEKMGKGITLSKEEAKMLLEIVSEIQ
ncbi:PC4/YdbC family ssDNA-binding protein [uncultured Ilyobacter sp.]